MALLEVEGTFRGERFRKGDFVIGSIDLARGSRKLAKENGWDGATEQIAVKGEAEPEELQWSGRYRFYGSFESYRNRYTNRDESQFCFRSFVPARAHDREGVVAYLAKAGVGRGLGHGTATKLFDEFGPDAVKVVREDFTQLQKVNKRITEENARSIAERLKKDHATEDAVIELTNLLNNRGLPRRLTRDAIKRWGNRAAEVIRSNPFELMEFHGVGFKSADALWIEFGLNPNRLRRQMYAAWHFITSDGSGSCWFTANQVIQAIKQAIGPGARPVAAIKMAVRLGRMSPGTRGSLAAIRSDGLHGGLMDRGSELWLADPCNANAESKVTDKVIGAIDESRPRYMTQFSGVEMIDTKSELLDLVRCRLCGRQLTADTVHVLGGQPYGPTCIQRIDSSGVEVIPLTEWFEKCRSVATELVRTTIEMAPSQMVKLPEFSLWPDPATIPNIDDHQREKLNECLTSRVCVLGGSPGTGKTFATAQLIKQMLAEGRVSLDDIAVGCPTGKAAVRISEVLAEYGVPVQARTWHSLLGVLVAEDGAWQFQYGESEPWPYRVVIGDEQSMQDIIMFSNVMKARGRSCHMLLVGDVNQLPPVGAGAPLRDLINSGVVGYGELTDIKRNSGGIVEACASIRDGQPWEPGDNLTVVEASTPGEQMDILKRCLRAVNSKYGLDPVWDSQVLVAVNAKSELSREMVNSALQDELNTNSRIEGTPFRKDDKIVCLKNGPYTAIQSELIARINCEEPDQVYVANGELAKVLSVEKKHVVAELSGPSRIVKIPRGKSSSGGTGCNWDLAYGLSCHKSQGSEWPIIFVMIDEYPGARRVCNREWIYTAISRGKQKVVLIGRKMTADAMCRKVAVGDRKTFLRERLLQETVSNLLEEL